jgi:hypothetical protein
MIVDDFIEPAVLTGFVREVPSPYALILNQFLPDRQINDIEAALDQVTRTNRAAKFRSWDAEVAVGQRDTFQRSRVKIPPVGLKLPIGEYERLMLERIRSGGDNRDAYIEAIYDDADTLTKSVYNRVELARGDVLVDGKFTLTDENGLTLEADFGIDASNIVSAGTAWTDHTNATILSNLKTWIDHYVDVNGERPGYMLTSNTVINNMLLASELRDLFRTGSNILNTSPNLVTPSMLTTVLQAYGYPPIVEYNTKIEVDGTNTRVIPDDKVIFLPADANQLGYTAWGITAEALELASGQNPGLAFNQLPGLVGVVMKDGDPVRTWTKVGATSMPIIVNPRLLMVADVI